MFISVQNMTGILIEFGYILDRINFDITRDFQAPKRMHTLEDRLALDYSDFG